MRYVDHRDNIKSGDLLVWSHRGIRSFYDFKIWLIRLFTQSEYTHVGIAWVINGRVFVLESVTPVPRIVPLRNLLPCYVINTGINWTDQVERKALEYIGNAHIGTYSQLEAVKAYLGLNSKQNNALQCVEYAKTILSEAGLQFQGKDVPADMVLELQQKGGTTTYIE